VSPIRPSGSPAARWAAVFFWCALIFAASATPADPDYYFRYGWLETVYIMIRKFGHWFVYAVLFLLTRRAIFVSFPGARRTASIPAFLFCLLYAASDEWHQTFVPGRAGRLYDVCIDAVGALSAWMWAPPLLRPRRAQRPAERSA
jgi:hypothetical protein